MDCPHCKARNIHIEMLREDFSTLDTKLDVLKRGKHGGIVGDKKVMAHSRYSCPNCLDEFDWHPVTGLTEFHGW